VQAGVVVAGSVYFDLVFAGLTAPPAAGREVRTAGLGSSPGGVATIAVALARLAVPVRLCAAFATDAFGQYLWEALAAEGVDLTGSRRCAGWTTPLTVSVASGADRSLVTHDSSAPVCAEELVAPEFPGRAVVVGLEAMSLAWLRAARSSGRMVVADVSWDSTGAWPPATLEKLREVDLFLPNADEAKAYTGASSPQRALRALAACTPGTVVVKDGARGAWAHRAGEEVFVEAVAVDALDSTGAGDVFDAAFLYASLEGWALGEQVRFANLCAALSTRSVGGALAAPCWREVLAQRDELVRDDPSRRSTWAFLRAPDDLATGQPPCARACPTFSLREAAVRTSGSGR
jgi:sugar/nucleoside kinase (ribokinase family)